MVLRSGKCCTESHKSQLSAAVLIRNILNLNGRSFAINHERLSVTGDYHSPGDLQGGKPPGLKNECPDMIGCHWHQTLTFSS